MRRSKYSLSLSLSLSRSLTPPLTRCATSLYEVLHVRKQRLTMEYALSAIEQIALGIFYLHQVKG